MGQIVPRPRKEIFLLYYACRKPIVLYRELPILIPLQTERSINFEAPDCLEGVSFRVLVVIASEHALTVKEGDLPAKTIF